MDKDKETLTFRWVILLTHSFLKNIHCLATEQQIELAWQFGADGSVNTLPCVPGEELECITTALRQREEGKHAHAHAHHYFFLFCPYIIWARVFSWLVHIWMDFSQNACSRLTVKCFVYHVIKKMYFRDVRKQHFVTRIASVQGHMLFICCVGHLSPGRLGSFFFPISIDKQSNTKVFIMLFLRRDQFWS